MDEINISILVEAKNEYTKQLSDILVPYLYEGINSIYEESKKVEDENATILKIFQDNLKKIHKWNQDIIDQETQRILERSQCTYLDDLITAVFISQTRILTYRNSTKKKINLKIPKLSRFIHKCYIECAREFYKNTYLINKEGISNLDRQRNLRESLLVIKECISDAIRKLLPFQEILKQYLDDPETESDEDITKTHKFTFKKKEEEEEHLSEEEKEELKEEIKQDIETEVQKITGNEEKIEEIIKKEDEIKEEIQPIKEESSTISESVDINNLIIKKQEDKTQIIPEQKKEEIKHIIIKNDKKEEPSTVNTTSESENEDDVIKNLKEIEKMAEENIIRRPHKTYKIIRKKHHMKERPKFLFNDAEETDEEDDE